MKKSIFLLVLTVLIISCSPKGYSINPSNRASVYCVKEFYYDSPEPVLKDLLYRALVEAINSAGGRLDCGESTEYYVDFRLEGVNFIPVGFSGSLRAFVYVAQANVGLKIYDRENNIKLSNSIIEKVQYVGSGMRADFEKRYAFADLAENIKVRIYSLLTGHGN